MKVGDIVFLRRSVEHPTQMYTINCNIQCEILSVIDHVAMLCPHNSGHEFITCLDNLTQRVDKK